MNQPHEKPLNKAVENHLKQTSLTDKQFDKLNKLQQAKITSKAKPLLQMKSISLFVASILLIVLTLFSSFQTNSPKNLLIEQIADEVALNHLKPKPLEVVSTQIVEVQKYFTKLDFLPIASLIFNQQNSKLLTGGRYCSIKGSRAAQLRYFEGNQPPTTLYQTNYHKAFSDTLKLQEGDAPIITYARGVEITIWQEKGLLMVTAQKQH